MFGWGKSLRSEMCLKIEMKKGKSVKSDMINSNRQPYVSND